MPSANTASNNNQNRRPARQTRVSTVNAILTSDRGMKSLFQQSGAEPKSVGHLEGVINNSSAMIQPLTLFLGNTSIDQSTRVM